MLKRDGNLEEEMMYHTFNMGIGMVLAVSMEEGDKTIKALREAGEVPYFLGEIVPGQGEKGVELC